MANNFLNENWLTKEILDNQLELNLEKSKEGLTYNKLVLFETEKIIRSFAGKFTNKTNNIFWDEIQEDFFINAYKYDYIYIYYKDNQFYLFKKIEPNKYLNLLENKETKIPDNSLVKFRWDSNKHRFYDWLEIMKQCTILEIIFKNNALTDSKKMKRKLFSNNKDIEDNEIKRFYDPTLPFIDEKIISNEAGTGNKFEPIETGQSKTNQSLQNLNEYFNWKANFMGYTTAQEQKAERKTFAEGQIDLANTLYLDNLVLTNLKVFAYRMKEKFNVDLDFEETISLTPETLQSNQPEQEINNETELQ